MKDKGEDVESYGKIKARMLSPMKHKGEDVESYESIKTEDVESKET